MTTTFGLELVIQLEPVFQVYVTVGPQFRGQTRGKPLSVPAQSRPDGPVPTQHGQGEKSPNRVLHIQHPRPQAGPPGAGDSLVPSAW